MSITRAILFVLIVIVGGILLQIFLSRRESKWPGLILPILSFLISLLYPLNMAAPAGDLTAGFLAQMLMVWLLGNIPTVVLLLIYAVCREKLRRSRQLDKMNIQDL